MLNLPFRSLPPDSLIYGGRIVTYHRALPGSKKGKRKFATTLVESVYGQYLSGSRIREISRPLGISDVTTWRLIKGHTYTVEFNNYLDRLRG